MIGRLKYYIILFSLIFLVILTSHNGNAQDKNNCLEKIQGYYDDMAKIAFPEGNKVYHFYYINHTEINVNQAVSTKKVPVHVYMSKDQMHNITDDIEIYQDMQDAFMLIKSRKMLIHSGSSLGINKKQRLAQILNFQDSLFRHMELKNCKEIIGKSGTKYLIVNTKLDSITNISHRMRNIRFTYNIDEKKINRIKFSYMPGLKLKSLTQVNVEIDLNHSRKMNKPVKEIFFTTNKKLRPEYAGYKYVIKN